MSDLKFALRALLKSPGFSLVAVLTIAVGIGANTALFTIFDRLVLNPVEVPEPRSLVAFWSTSQSLGFRAPAVSWPRYELIRANAKSFAQTGLSSFDSFTLTGNGDPEQLNGLRVSASFLPTLGIKPALGRNFTPEEDVPNGPAVCILSHELWKTRFGSRESIVGETIQLNNQSWQVVGVLAPHFTNPYTTSQILAPRVFEVNGITQVQVQNGAVYAQPIARLKPGVTVAQATAELAAISRTYQEQFSTRLDASNVTEPQDFVGALVGNLKPTFYTLIGAVSFVLLIACANVASLFLGRLTARHKEIAIRQSLGATRGQVIRQFLAESLLFSVVAGGLGLLIGLWALAGVESLLASQLPPHTTLTLDPRAILFTTGLTLLSALLVGLAPAIQASRAGLLEVLKDAARGSSSARGGRFRASLIVVEAALSVVLLVGSALLLLSFLRLQRTPPGYDPRGVAGAFVSLPAARYGTGPEQAAFFERVLEQLRANPQVRDAGTSLGLPLANFAARSPYAIAGRPIAPLSQRPLANLEIVSLDYFRTMRIPVKAGRVFTAEDRNGGPGVCVINESLARRLFPGESALDHTILRGRDAEVPHRIVGVVADVKSGGLNAPAPDQIYFSLQQLGRGAMTVIARLAPNGGDENAPGDANALQAIIRSAVAAVDKDQPISLFQTLENGLAQSLGVQRIVASLTAAFAGLALVLATVGLYSVLAYTVTQRTPEIGIRMALGAQRGQVIGMVMQGGLRLVVLGLVIGLIAAAGIGRAIQSLLYEVQPLDPLVYAAVALLFAGVAALACLVPSLRASRIDPVIALRSE